jgi:GT2 family glycosyltransferase
VTEASAVLAVVIVNYETGAWLERCLHSLERAFRYYAKLRAPGWRRATLPAAWFQVHWNLVVMN